MDKNQYPTVPRQRIKSGPTEQRDMILQLEFSEAIEHTNTQMCYRQKHMRQHKMVSKPELMSVYSVIDCRISPSCISDVQDYLNLSEDNLDNFLSVALI
ncbi:MAG: hypothetical protein J07HQW2_02827 [Haloquadratum walsbyi J07HQW2]|jgi:hypothetical protein|uniref:Uncharacterized protein n=1 Tax=Haloquadratum walsbyi J07HQW2 TaxID=1238425 RepID=U1NGV6_9EURY|nr:MAG: hypothetical protein J07HQW2_02827 [Haloquadratum walsbyi J07HQW2]